MNMAVMAASLAVQGFAQQTRQDVDLLHGRKPSQPSNGYHVCKDCLDGRWYQTAVVYLLRSVASLYSPFSLPFLPLSLTRKPDNPATCLTDTYKVFTSSPSVLRYVDGSDLWAGASSPRGDTTSCQINRTIIVHTCPAERLLNGTCGSLRPTINNASFHRDHASHVFYHPLYPNAFFRQYVHRCLRNEPQDRSLSFRT